VAKLYHSVVYIARLWITLFDICSEFAATELILYQSD